MKVTGSTVEQLEKDKPRGKCRKWRLWLSTESGRRSRRVTGTWTQAQEALAAFAEEVEDILPEAGAFASYAASWARWRAGSGDLAPGTLANDQRAVRALCRTKLSAMELTAITPADCRDALLWLKEHPARGSELSNTTMNKLHVALRCMLEQAVDDGLIARNPMAKVRAPRPDTAEKRALTPAELHALLDALDLMAPDGRVMAVYLIALCGLRRAEACALSPEDAVGPLLRVDKAVKERDGAIGAPKSAAGVRCVPMPRRLSDKVSEWLRLREALGLGDAPTLCCNTRGGTLRPQLLQRWWSGDSVHNGVRESLGCADVTLHQLRHSNLSMMARHMSPFDLQRYAGWSSIAPAKVYVHDDMDAVARAVAQAWDAGA